MVIVVAALLFLLFLLALVLAFNRGASGISHADAEPLVLHR